MVGDYLECFQRLVCLLRHIVPWRNSQNDPVGGKLHIHGRKHLSFWQVCLAFVVCVDVWELCGRRGVHRAQVELEEEKRKLNYVELEEEERKLNYVVPRGQSPSGMS